MMWKICEHFRIKVKRIRGEKWINGYNCSVLTEGLSSTPRTMSDLLHQLLRDPRPLGFIGIYAHNHKYICIHT